MYCYIYVTLAAMLEWLEPQMTWDCACTCRKLMGQKPQFADLKDVHPSIHATLCKLLEYTGDVTDLSLSFQVPLGAIPCYHQTMQPTGLHVYGQCAFSWHMRPRSPIGLVPQPGDIRTSHVAWPWSCESTALLYSHAACWSDICRRYAELQT